MPERLLVIGNRNYSSWSLRPWLLLRQLGLPFTEERIALDQPDTKARILARSPAGRVPVLIEDELGVWESLAIIEHVADANNAVWPTEPATRAMARSISAEMHGGFTALRNELPMNVRAAGRKVRTSPAADADIARIKAIWSSAREAHGAAGPWLLGAFSAADAMFAPVASRFRTYGIDLPDALAQWQRTVLECAAMQEWATAARAEAEVIEHEEVG
ncbi:MAG: glutathione S-transferase family protein [Geminicoccaceae bacterium]|jgi:glutathione S-transferase|nr:glutathione S-transferase family protein [Geminicoccaceae bacterium]MCB9966530.1 glutathione S-transferase family protein [Geminicoccaceae bacterium]HRY24424.1 glutathione S-transferase family protein [Geminicoccaceae bacterium]